MYLRSFPYGFIIRRPRGRISSRPSSKVGSLRSRITSFSLASRRRMREYLVSHTINHYVRVGVTLTLPWSVSDWSVCMDDFRTVVHRFRTYWRRMFPSSSCVYRIELQKRGAPHIHMIAYHSSEDIPLINDSYFNLWFRSLGDLHEYSYFDFARHGVVVESVPDVPAMIRYLSDHATKSKQAQLGYSGKQWGVLGSDNFELIDHSIIDVPDEVEHRLVRTIKSMNRYRVKSDCPFGYRYVKIKRVRSVSFFSSDVLLRLLRSLE